MEYVLYVLLKDYDIEYNRKTKILTIGKPIEVSFFKYIKFLLRPYRQYIKDIRVDTIKGEYYEHRY